MTSFSSVFSCCSCRAGHAALGTKGGIRTDVYARALRDDGSVIEGLYAAGNVSAPVMGHTYPGPGGTIGPGDDVRVPGGATHCGKN